MEVELIWDTFPTFGHKKHVFFDDWTLIYFLSFGIARCFLPFLGLFHSRRVQVTNSCSWNLLILLVQEENESVSKNTVIFFLAVEILPII